MCFCFSHVFFFFLKMFSLFISVFSVFFFFFVALRPPENWLGPPRPFLFFPFPFFVFLPFFYWSRVEFLNFQKSTFWSKSHRFCTSVVNKDVVVKARDRDKEDRDLNVTRSDVRSSRISRYHKHARACARAINISRSHGVLQKAAHFA